MNAATASRPSRAGRPAAAAGVAFPVLAAVLFLGSTALPAAQPKPGKGTSSASR